MTINMAHDYKSRLPKNLQTFSMRVGRKCFLEYHCESDHPVLQSEISMVSMAKSKLLESIYAEYSKQEFENIKGALVEAIVQAATEWVRSHVDDKKIIAVIVRSVRADAALLFPLLH